MSSLITHTCNLINTANGVLTRQRVALGITLTHDQWLDCIAYVFAVDNGDSVAEYCADKPELQAALAEAWDYYNTAARRLNLV